MPMFKEIIKEICNELNIKYTILSKDWIIKLEKDNEVRYLTGNKFDLNGHAIGNILDDKYAFYEILKNINIPVCLHRIIYHKNNNQSYAIGCNTEEYILNCFNEFHNDVVIKPNKGSMGIGVHHITNKDELINITNNLLINNYSISICPYYHIKNEYRVIVLDNEIKLIYKKINPIVIGDGKSTLKELLIKFNYNYYIDKDVLNIIPNKNEIITHDFHFNLSKGSIATIDIDYDTKEKICQLALEVSKKVGITFASIDIIETTNNELLVLEANSGVTINKATNFIPNGYNVAKEIYKEAILRMFDK